jgi:hypothetical protein
MPAVACAGCANLVDTQDFLCKKCGDKKPFQCSKCNKRLSSVEIFEPEKLTFRKTVFCRACGPAVAVVTCHHCSTGLVRNSGRERIGSKGDALIYHEACWKTYELQVRTSRIVLLLVSPILAILFAWGAWSKSEGSVLTTLALAVVGLAAGVAVSRVFSPRGG